MFVSNLVLPAACLLFLRTAIAAPAPDDLELRVEGVAPATTPVLTASTITAAVNPAATNDKKGKGGSTECHNLDGEFKPFCQPKHNDVYYPGSNHFIIWDPVFFHNLNSTLVQVMGFYATNETDIPMSGPPGEEEQAFTSEHIAAGWGHYQWQPTKSLITSQKAPSVNITLRIVALPQDGQAAQWLTGPTITLRHKPKKTAPPKQSGTDDHALYIALPTVFGVVMLVIVVVMFCTRKARRVEMEDLLRSARASASRRRGFGGLSKKDRARNKEQNIRLMDRNSADSDEEARGWDDGWSHEVPGRKNKKVDRKRV